MIAGSRPCPVHRMDARGKGESFMAVKETYQTSNVSPHNHAETKDSDDQKMESKGIHTESSKKEKKPFEKKSFQEIVAARREQMNQITERLEKGLKEYMSNDAQFKKVLETMAKFHHYSANNVLLIAMQMPSATHVASYSSWQKRFNRQVMKGQHGISIIAPAPYKKKTQQEVQDPRTGKPVLGPDGRPQTKEVEITVPHFKVSKIFDISQTRGEPLPELDVPELTGTAENYEIFMDAMHAVSPVPIRFDEIAGGAKGYYDSANKEIVIQSGMSEIQTMKTTVHELAHARLHDRDTMREQGLVKDQRTRETEAEAIAHVLLSHYQIDSSDYSIPYLASYAESMDTTALHASLDTIRRTASEILDEVETYIAERDVDRYTIYQIEDGTPAADYSFMGLDFVKEQGYRVSMEYYQDVYHGYLRSDDTLDSLYVRFNRDDRPGATQMHSLSVSDVIVLHKNGEDKAFYVDSLGFTEIPEFFQEIDSQKALTFYVAECMDFPVMGEYHGNLSLEEAVSLYRSLPSDQLHGGKGIGFTLQDGSEHSGDHPLLAAGRIQEEEINSIPSLHDDPVLQDAVRQAGALLTEHPAEVIARETEPSTITPPPISPSIVNPPQRNDVPTNTPEPAGISDFSAPGTADKSASNVLGIADRSLANPSGAIEKAESKAPVSRKESVLASLREHQKKTQTAGKDSPERTRVPQRKKGEQSL